LKILSDLRAQFRDPSSDLLPTQEHFQVRPVRVCASRPGVGKIDAKRGNWVYNADRLGTQNGNPCLYQAASWKTARRVVAKVEFHAGELLPRVGFIVTNPEAPSRAVVRLYNKRGTAEQWIKEGKQGTRVCRLAGIGASPALDRRQRQATGDQQEGSTFACAIRDAGNGAPRALITDAHSHPQKE